MPGLDSPPPASNNERRAYTVGGVTPPFRFSSRRVGDTLMNAVTTIVDGTVYILGPILICFASAIICGLAYSFFVVMLPMIREANAKSPYGSFWVASHVLFVVYILTNVIFNYVSCVMTRNKGAGYDAVVRELAEATGFVYPETDDEVAQFKREYEERMVFRMERRQARLRQQQQPGTSTSTAQRRTNVSSTPTTPSTTRPQPPLRKWMLMGPLEWGFCTYTNQPKPPRSHYDHVTKTLTLNMDHYCPWMFNCVGYFNYRYFCSFLFHVFFGMLYGVLVSLRSFSSISTKVYYEQIRHNQHRGVDGLTHPERIHDYVPLPKERTPIAFSFMICISVGLAVMCLGGFHLYLVLTAQTTIEFHGNCANRRRAARMKRKWKNPYDFGTLRNWQHVFGASRHPLLALLIPSRKEPEFLPVPLEGDKSKRQPQGKKEDRVFVTGEKSAQQELVPLVNNTIV